jgi:hypothetical protein
MVSEFVSALLKLNQSRLIPSIPFPWAPGFRARVESSGFLFSPLSLLNFGGTSPAFALFTKPTSAASPVANPSLIAYVR